jgi:esterase/lipase superfamily enzyme
VPSPKGRAEDAAAGVIASGEVSRFKNIVSIAPDVGVRFFLDSLESLRRHSSLITLYATSNDYALRISEDWNGTTRAGTGGADQILVDQSMQSIDVVLADDDIPVERRSVAAYYEALRGMVNSAAIDSHSYFYKDTKVLTDIRELLVAGLDAPKRTKVHLLPHMKGVSPPVPYWELPKN